MPHVARVASTSEDSATSTLDLTLTQAVPVGHTLVLAVCSSALASQSANFTATDDEGNTWTERFHEFKQGTVQISALTCPVTTALASGDKITVAHGGVNASLWVALVEDFDDLQGFDSSATLNGYGTDMAVGPTAPGAQAQQLTFAAFAFGGNDTSFTPQEGFFSTGAVQVTNGTNYRNLALEYRYVNASGTRSASASSASNSVWAGGIATFDSGAQASTTARPNSVVANTGGWTNVGGAADIAAALADESDGTYAETSDAPNAAAMQLGFPGLSDGRIQVKVRHSASAASPALSATYEVLSDSTVIATRTVPVASLSATDYSFTLTDAEMANAGGTITVRPKMTSA